MRVLHPLGREMRDIFEEIFERSPLDPMEAARQSARPQLRRRFYRSAEVEATDGEVAIRLDGRAVRTPARRPLAVPTPALATAIAAEWNAQEEVVDPAKMPLTRLANSIIDGVAAAPEAVAAEVERYFGSDLVMYRAASPQELVARQKEAWDPLLDWARVTLQADFIPTEGVMFVAQPADALAAAARALPCDPWRLGALSVITTLTGSALIALAILHGRLSPEAAWAAAHVDEDWNMEHWGADTLALARRADQFAELQAAARTLALCVKE